MLYCIIVYCIAYSMSCRVCMYICMHVYVSVLYTMYCTYLHHTYFWILDLLFFISFDIYVIFFNFFFLLLLIVSHRCHQFLIHCMKFCMYVCISSFFLVPLFLVRFSVSNKITNKLLDLLLSALHFTQIKILMFFSPPFHLHLHSVESLMNNESKLLLLCQASCHGPWHG